MGAQLSLSRLHVNNASSWSRREWFLFLFTARCHYARHREKIETEIEHDILVLLVSLMDASCATCRP